MKKVVFFLGKGGVGKTTLSAAAAWRLNAKGKRVLILSLDPAHNLGDVFHRTLTNEGSEIRPGLEAREIDLGHWTAKYLETCRNEIKATYNYTSALNMDSYVDILKHSPGIEEYAVLWAIEDVYRKEKDSRDFIIFDTPPTALTLRFLAMPFLSQLWVRELAAMREKILGKRQTILKVNPEARIIRGVSDKKDDRVYGKLAALRGRLEALGSLLSRESRFTVIVNPDELSLTEAERIRRELEKIEIGIDCFCVNKAPGGSGEFKTKESFGSFPVFSAALLSEGLGSAEDLGRIDIAELLQHLFYAEREDTTT